MAVRAHSTRECSQAVAQTLRARGHDPPVVAHFVNRLVLRPRVFLDT